MALSIVQLVCTDAFAGTERYVATLAAALDAVPGNEYAVTVFGGQAQAMQRELVGTAVHWRRAPTVAAAIKALGRFGKADLVHAHLTAAEFAAVACRPLNRAPIVASRHIAKRRGASGPAKAAGLLISRGVSAQIAVSRYVADSVEGRSTVILPGSPVAAGTPLPAADRPSTVLLAQRLELEKRTDVALRAWAASGLGLKGWRLRIAGEGALRDTLLALAAELGIVDSIEWLGYRSDMAMLRSQAAMLLASCPTEPFGLSVVEAMADGLPVVAVRGAGHDETVGTAPGAAMFDLSDPSDGGGLLAALAADPKRRDELAAQAQQIQRAELNSARQIQAVLQLYSGLIR